jgi:hypothetical protein
MLPRKLLFAVTVLLFAISSASLAQNLQNLVHQPPDGAGIGFLLTDGSAIFQGNNLSDWWKLTPDAFGSYVKGTWSQIASLPSGYDPLYFASAVLADGRLVIVGGEYDSYNFVLTNKAAIYDPKKNTWTALGHPKGWGYIGDSPSVVLPDGKFMVGRKLDKRMAVLDPATLKWAEVGSAGKSDFNAEEGWTLMPDGSILTFDVKHAPHSEKYISSMGEWVTAGSTIVDLHSPHEGGCIPYPGGVIPLRERWVPPYFDLTVQFSLPARVRMAAADRDTRPSIIRERSLLIRANGRRARIFRMMTTPAIPLLPC